MPHLKALGWVGLQMLQSAQGLSVGAQQSGDEETIDYNNQLRQGIFEAYSGIFNGLSKEKVDTYLAPYAQVCPSTAYKLELLSETNPMPL